MHYPYLLISDLHCHAWSAFAKTLESGINSRLGIILDEFDRACEVLHKAGGRDVVIAGDIFHERGKLAPSVFNPTFECIRLRALAGFRFFAIPGNHDLEGKNTTELGNAIQTLGSLDGFQVVTGAGGGVLGSSGALGGVAMIPWCSSYDELRNLAQNYAHNHDVSNIDLVIHAGINGVLAGMPDHGLNAAEVAAWGYRRVFAGHYHNFKEMEGGRVVSIGATTHQQWGDLGTKAGFILVYKDRIEHHASHAPSFIEITEAHDPDDIPLMVDGNYVRVRGWKLTDAEVKQFREELEGMGALGASFQVARNAPTPASGRLATSGLTLDESIARHIDSLTLPSAAVVKSMCDDILTTVRSVTV